MPELPEVETIRRQLLPVCKGQQICRVKLHTAGMLKNFDAKKFPGVLRKKTITNLTRRGKFLIFECDGIFLVFHLGMSGIFLTRKEDSNYPQHIHLSMRLCSERNIYFQDVRRFGKILLTLEPFSPPGLGIDPLDENFTLYKFNKLINLSKKNIKHFLMDQSKVAGIGNIYANEILFRAAVSPFRRANELSSGQHERIFQEIRDVLNESIRHFGTTYSAYRTVDGSTGQNQNFLQVYQRDGKSCPRCGRSIRKTYLGNRSTFYCPACQNAEGD